MNDNPYESSKTLGDVPPQGSGMLRRLRVKSLVVVGILGLVVALLLPAVQRGSSHAAMGKRHGELIARGRNFRGLRHYRSRNVALERDVCKPLQILVVGSF